MQKKERVTLMMTSTATGTLIFNDSTPSPLPQAAAKTGNPQYYYGSAGEVRLMLWVSGGEGAHRYCEASPISGVRFVSTDFQDFMISEDVDRGKVHATTRAQWLLCLGPRFLDFTDLMRRYVDVVSWHLGGKRRFSSKKRLRLNRSRHLKVKRS